MSQDFIDAQMNVWGGEELHDSRNPAAAKVVREELKALMSRFLKDGLLLDVGGYRGLQVEGLNAIVHDMAFPALKDALTRVDKVSFGDIHDLPYADSVVDMILMSHVLEHSHKPEELLKEMQRVLKPDGHLVIVVPNAAGLGQLLKLWRHGEVKPSGNQPWEPPEHLHHFTAQNTHKFMEENGWDVVHFEGDILDFPLRNKLKCYGLAGSLGRSWAKRAESLIVVCRYKG